MTLEHISATLARQGLCILGTCTTQDADDLPHDGSIVLIGPDEPHFWPLFTQSSEYQDGAANPMDRWSKRILDKFASDLDARALYPFGDPPFLPFFTWAQRSGRFWPSPIHFLVHDTAGLFVSFRGALLIKEKVPLSAAKQPCIDCDAPCKTACPVGAFREGYNVPNCKSHIASVAGTPCMIEGCAARRACPVGASRRLPAQAAFHMESFL